MNKSRVVIVLAAAAVSATAARGYAQVPEFSKVEIEDDTRIIPGHGPLAGKADLKGFRDMLAGVRDKVRPLVDAGKTVEETVAAKPTAAYDAKWGGGFLKPEQFAAMVNADLARKKKSDR